MDVHGGLLVEGAPSLSGSSWVWRSLSGGRRRFGAGREAAPVIEIAYDLGLT